MAFRDNNYSMAFEDTGPAFSDEDINAYVQANIGNPAAIASAAEQYGVSLDDLSRATGYDTGTINNYFSQANVTPYYQEPAPLPQPQVAYTPEPISAPVAPQTYTPPEPQVFDNVQDFGTYDYFKEDIPEPPPRPQPQYVAPEPPPAPAPAPEPQYVAPPAPVAQAAPMAPVAPAAPTVTPAAPQKSLVEQILGQGTTSKWTGQGFGSAEKNAEDMAKILSGIGITDISQFGKITKSGINTEVYPDGTGGFTDSKGNKVDPSLVTNQSYAMESGDVNYYTAPVGTEEVFGNKVTGQAVPNTYGERQTGDAFGGTYAGEGNTGYRVQFDEKGNPYFYTSGQSSSDAEQWMPIVQLALAATGAGGLLGNALLGTGAGAVATNALGNAIISGTLTGATGGDALKGALLGGIGGAIGGYLQGNAPTGGPATTPSGAIDGANINFADLAETDVINALKERGLSNAQIGQWMENASAADLGYVAPADTVPGANVDFNELADNALIDSLKAQGLSNQQISQFIENTGAGTGPVAPVSPGVETVTVTGQAPVTPAPVVPTMVDPNILAAVTTQLNTNVKTPVPELEIKGDKVTKTDDTTPTVTVTGDKVVTPVSPVVPTVEVVGDKVVKKDDTVPTVEVVADKPVKPVTPDVPVIEVVGDKPVKPVTPDVPVIEVVGDKPVKPVTPDVPVIEVVADKPVKPVTPDVPVVEVVAPKDPVVEPPVVVPPPPPVIVPPVVLPPPPPPPPPVVTPPPVVVPPSTNGMGLNPGLIETTPFYNTTNDAQAKYYWGDHGFQTGPAFDAASYNAVAAPATPWGAQGVAAPLSAEDYQAIVEGRYTPEQFTPATRTQAYNPALLQTPVGQVNVSSGGGAVSGPVAPNSRYDMTNTEVQQIASVLGAEKAQALALAMANGDQATINAIKSQYDYALQQMTQYGGM